METQSYKNLETAESSLLIWAIKELPWLCVLPKVTLQIKSHTDIHNKDFWQSVHMVLNNIQLFQVVESLKVLKGKAIH